MIVILPIRWHPCHSNIGPPDKVLRTDNLHIVADNKIEIGTCRNLSRSCPVPPYLKRRNNLGN